MNYKKSNGKAKLLIVIIIIIVLAIVGIIVFLKTSGILGKLLNISGNSSSYVVTASSGESSAELTAFSNETKPSLTAADKSAWPKGTIGGLYKLEPRGDFSEPVKLKITFNEDPGPFFSFGYWQADVKKWEWIPTIKRAPNVYETVLFHASEVGGAQNPNYAPRFSDQKNQAMANDALSTLEGEMAQDKSGNGDYQKGWEKVKQLADKLIKDFCDALSGKTGPEFMKTSRPIINDFLTGWEMTQYLGFSSLQPGFEDAVDSAFTPKVGLFDKRECKKRQEKLSAYIVNQIDDYEVKVDLNLAQGMYKASQKGKTRVVSAGAPLSTPGWKTNWRVYQSYKSFSSTDQRLFKEYSSPDAYALIDIGSYDTGVEGTDLMRLSFDLTGLKEGDTFPIKEQRIAAYDSRTVLGSPPMKGVIILKDSDGYTFKWKGTKDMYSITTIDPGLVIETTGVLLTDHGDTGGVIGFEKKSIFTPEQLRQFQEATKDAPPELKKLYDAQGNPTFVTGDLERKPLIITVEK